MSENRTLYLMQGRLEVKPKGYWLTSGGEKGPFGFYPHLKDEGGYPVFPDTQVNGDLRMAAGWLSRIDRRFNGKLIQDIFGDTPTNDHRYMQSRLYITDIKLTDSSKGKWRHEMFEVKPRIEIDDDTRTVKKNMLVFVETAYLEGLDLYADIYLGYFNDKERINEAREFIDSALTLIGGFGKSRSRGYGRGDITIKWNPVEEFSFKTSDNSHYSGMLTYKLTNLVNLRNKPVQPGSTQFLPSKRVISGDQLRGWFVSSYHSLFGTWPTMDEMAQISFPDLFPAYKTKEGNTIDGCPLAMTILKNEKDEVKDIFKERSAQDDVSRDQENFFKTKTKPLPKDYFVTAGDDFTAFPVKTERRIRNQIVSDFTTNQEGGLFVQEFVHAGTCFSGTLRLASPSKDSEFISRAVYILNNLKPVIGGAIFKSEVSVKDAAISEKKPLLVVSPVCFSPSALNINNCKYEKEGDRVVLNNANIITLQTVQTYNTTLKRPRRPRICIKPGSIIQNDEGIHEKDKLVSWGGFGKDIALVKKPQSDYGKESKTDTPKKVHDFKEPEDFNKLKEVITSAQTGFLKEFLNKHRKIEDVKRIAQERKLKYEEKGKKEWASLYGSILEQCKNDASGRMVRGYINFLLDEVFRYQRKEKRSKKGGS